MNVNSLKIIISIVIFVKILFYIGFFLVDDFNFFGGGNDSDYYDAYALGFDDKALNTWPVLLRWIADAGLYSRNAISFFLKIISLLIVPYLASKLSSIKGSAVHKKSFLYLFFIISMYPSLYYLSLDIYRDVFIVFLYLVGLIVFKKLSESKLSLTSFFVFLLGVLVSFVLYKFRPYLGFGYLIALFFSFLYSFRCSNFLLNVFLLCLILQVANGLGLLEPILKYRSLFEHSLEGGSNLGIVFSNDLFFIFYFFQNILYQIFGFYFINSSSMLAFILESVPFLFALLYLIKNKIYSNKFVDYLIVFFIAYSVVWLLGNDNLGTATRLRMFNYISVYIACFIVYQNKNLYLKVSYSV